MAKNFWISLFLLILVGTASAGDWDRPNGMVESGWGTEQHGALFAGVETGPFYFKMGELFRNYDHEAVYTSGLLTLDLHTIAPDSRIMGLAGIEIFFPESQGYEVATSQLLWYIHHIHIKKQVNNYYSNNYSVSVMSNTFASLGLHKKLADREFFWFGLDIGKVTNSVYYGGFTTEGRGKVHDFVGLKGRLAFRDLEGAGSETALRVSVFLSLEGWDFVVSYQLYKRESLQHSVVLSLEWTFLS